MNYIWLVLVCLCMSQNTHAQRPNTYMTLIWGRYSSPETEHVVADIHNSKWNEDDVVHLWIDYKNQDILMRLGDNTRYFYGVFLEKDDSLFGWKVYFRTKRSPRILERPDQFNSPIQQTLLNYFDVASLLGDNVIVHQYDAEDSNEKGIDVKRVSHLYLRSKNYGYRKLYIERQHDIPVVQKIEYFTDTDQLIKTQYNTISVKDKRWYIDEALFVTESGDTTKVTIRSREPVEMSLSKQSLSKGSP